MESDNQSMGFWMLIVGLIIVDITPGGRLDSFCYGCLLNLLSNFDCEDFPKSPFSTGISYFLWFQESGSQKRKERNLKSGGVQGQILEGKGEKGEKEIQFDVPANQLENVNPEDVEMDEFIEKKEKKFSRILRS